MLNYDIAIKALFSFCEKEMPELLDAYDLSAYKVKISRISEAASK